MPVRTKPWARVATFAAILAAHMAGFYLLPQIGRPLIPREADETPTIAVFLPSNATEEPTQPSGSLASVPTAGRPHTARVPMPKSPQEPTATTQPAEPSSQAITPPAAPDWYAEARIAAKDQITSEAAGRNQPSPLAPHDFSGVTPGSTDVRRPRFVWSHAATHRVENLPEGGFLLNINDRCAIAVVIILIPFCRIGHIEAHGDLFDDMKMSPPAD